MTLPWKTESNKSISVMKNEISGSLHYHYEKGGCCGRQTCRLDVNKIVSLQGCIFWIDGLSIWQTGHLQTLKTLTKSISTLFLKMTNWRYFILFCLNLYFSRQRKSLYLAKNLQDSLHCSYMLLHGLSED